MRISKAVMLLSLALVFAGSSADAADLLGTAPGKALYRIDTTSGQASLIGNFNFSDPKELELFYFARDPSGTLYGLSSAQNGAVLINVPSMVYIVNEQNAQLTPVASIGNVMLGGATIDPTDGSLYFIEISTSPYLPSVGPDHSLWRLDLAGGLKVQLLGQFNTFVGQFRDLVFDASGQLYSINEKKSEFWKVDKAYPDSTNTQVVGAGLAGGIDVSWGSALATCPVTGKAYALEKLNERLFTIDLFSGMAIYDSQLPTLSFKDITPVGCLGSISTTGAGCPGTGGLTPSLSVSGCPDAGQIVEVSIDNGLGNAQALMLLGLTAANLPLGGQCMLHFNPLPQVLAFGLPASGSLMFPALTPPAVPALDVHLQMFIIDPAGAIGYSGTNAVTLSIK